MSTKKIVNTGDELWETFVNTTNDLGEGSSHARGTVPLHPTAHWLGEEAIEHYSRKVFELEGLQTMRGQHWLERGMRKDGINEYWVLERVIAASMEYSVSDYEFMMKVFFVEWEKDLKPDGRTNKNKAQWIRWCEIHLARHHRTAKAVRALDVLHELGLLYPGWRKQVYAHNNNTQVDLLNYASPWDNQPSLDVVEMNELNQKYAKLPGAQSSSSASSVQHIQPSASFMAPQPNARSANMRAEISDSLEDIHTDNGAATNSTSAMDADSDSDHSFLIEGYYPDHVHEYDAAMGKPATTYPQLPNAAGSASAPAADEWSMGIDGFSTQSNTSYGVDPATFRPPHGYGASHEHGAQSQSIRPISAGVRPYIQPRIFTPETAPPHMTAQGMYIPPDYLVWANTNERDFSRAVEAVDADFPPQQRESSRERVERIQRMAREDLEQNPQDYEYLKQGNFYQRQWQKLHDHPTLGKLYHQVARYKGISQEELDRRYAKRVAHEALRAERRANPAKKRFWGNQRDHDTEVVWGIREGDFPGPPENAYEISRGLIPDPAAAAPAPAASTAAAAEDDASASDDETDDNAATGEKRKRTSGSDSGSSTATGVAAPTNTPNVVQPEVLTPNPDQEHADVRKGYLSRSWRQRDL